MGDRVKFAEVWGEWIVINALWDVRHSLTMFSWHSNDEIGKNFMFSESMFEAKESNNKKGVSHQQ